MTADIDRWSPSADPETLKAISNLRLKVRKVIEGLQGGAHPSLHFGASVEFAEHKRYSPGDDIRHIDWRALARTDRYFVKRHQREVVLNCLLVLDCSASMGYRGSRAHTHKLGFAVELLSAIAYLLVRQGDAAGLFNFASEPELFIPPGRRPDQLPVIMKQLALTEAKKSGGTAFLDAIAEVASHEGQRGMIILASDLWGADEKTELALARLAARGHDIAVFHVLDPDELDLPFSAPVTLVGMEGEPRVEVDPVLIREDYRRAVTAVVERWRTFSGKSGIDFMSAPTDQAPSAVLSEFAARRQGPRRGP
jgi:uncharacterized protein (DUF58 family)